MKKFLAIILTTGALFAFGLGAFQSVKVEKSADPIDTGVVTTADNVDPGGGRP